MPPFTSLSTGSIFGNFKAGIPTVVDMPNSGMYQLWTNTNTGAMGLWANKSGVIIALGGDPLSGGQPWTWNTTTTVPPGTSQIRTNAGTWTGVTTLNIDKHDANNVDQTSALRAIKTGDELNLLQISNTTNWVRWSVTSVAVDQGTYMTIGIAYKTGGGVVAASGQNCTFSLLQSGVAAQWFTNIGPPVSTLGRVGDMYLNGADGYVWQNVDPTGWTRTTTNITGPVGPVGPQGLIADAPSDGTPYARQNVGWVRSVNITGGTTIRNPVSGATSLSVEAPSGYLMLSSGSGTHLVYNSYWDGASWININPANSYSLLVIAPTFTWYTSPAGASASVPWVSRMTLDASGNLTVTGGLTVNASASISTTLHVGGTIQCYYLYTSDGSNGVCQATNGNLYLRSASGSYTVDSGGQFYMNGYFTTATGMASPIWYINSSWGGSYYINISSNVCQIVNMNLLSWGWVGFSANGGINISWNGGQLQTTHSLMVGGSTIYLAANGGVYWQWTGNMYCPNSVEAGGYLRANNGYVYFRNDNAIAWYWDGTWLRHTGGSGIGTAGSYVWMANTTAVGMYWDGTYTHIRPNVFSEGAVYVSNNAGVFWNFDGSMHTNVNLKADSQISSEGAYDGSHQNCFLAPNTANYTGQALAQQWGTWSSVDHATQYGLRLEPIDDPLSHVLAITGVSYDHASFAHPSHVQPMLNEQDVIATSPMYGFSANEVARHYPELVGFHPDSGEPESIDLDRMGVILWEAFRQYVERTDARIAELEAKLVA